MSKKYIVLGLCIGTVGLVLWQVGAGWLSSLGFGGLVCGGLYLLAGLVKMIFKR